MELGLRGKNLVTALRLHANSFVYVYVPSNSYLLNLAFSSMLMISVNMLMMLTEYNFNAILLPQHTELR